MSRTAPYRTCTGASRVQLREKGSRFLALLEPCYDRVSAEKRLDAIGRQYHEATHICWAWRLLSEPEPGEASSDAGEPAGTAGVPMLGVLQSSELWNVLGVVVRWFGGIKLGRGGLVRAYRDSLAEAVGEAEIIEVLPRVDAVVNSPLGNVGDLHKLLSLFDVNYVDEVVEGKEVRMTVSLPARDVEKLKERVVDATRGRGSVYIPGKGTV